MNKVYDMVVWCIIPEWIGSSNVLHLLMWPKRVCLVRYSMMVFERTWWFHRWDGSFARHGDNICHVFVQSSISIWICAWLYRSIRFVWLDLWISVIIVRKFKPHFCTNEHALNGSVDLRLTGDLYFGSVIATARLALSHDANQLNEAVTLCGGRPAPEGDQAAGSWATSGHLSKRLSPVQKKESKILS